MKDGRWIHRTGVALTLVLVVAGCEGFKKATPQNFTRALNAYYGNHDDCLFPSAIHFPYEAATAGSDADPRKKGLDALADAGLLKSLEDKDIHVKRYSLTTFGSRIPPRFCYGHRVVTSIDSFTPPATDNGQQVTHVDYHYKMMDVPAWTDSDEIRKVFPVFAQSTAGNAQDRATLVLTINGWRIPE
jgi:hypothetical protein